MVPYVGAAVVVDVEREELALVEALVVPVVDAEDVLVVVADDEANDV
jgi:hypothetical protein